MVGIVTYIANDCIPTLHFHQKVLNAICTYIVTIMVETRPGQSIYLDQMGPLFLRIMQITGSNKQNWFYIFEMRSTCSYMLFQNVRSKDNSLLFTFRNVSEAL